MLIRVVFYVASFTKVHPNISSESSGFSLEDTPILMVSSIFSFSSLFEEDSHFDEHIFEMGLVQPPTSYKWGHNSYKYGEITPVTQLFSAIYKGYNSTYNW